MASSLSRKIPMVMGALLLAATLFTAYTAQNALATHEPANKAAAVGSDIDQIEEGDNAQTLLLRDVMRVSSPEDLIVQVTAECSILTELTTGPSGTSNATDFATAYGSVRLWVEIDGNRVPVSADDLAEDGADEEDESTGDRGEVTFCNRTYHRTVTDGESDGLDSEHDYIRTRTANAFNWIAFDTGAFYDIPENGNNILEVELWAEYDTSIEGEAVADAFVGSRTMIAEPIRVSNHEQVGESDGYGN